MPRTLTAITAELSELYAEEPSLTRIDPILLKQIENAGGEFDFVTGKVWMPHLVQVAAPHTQPTVAQKLYVR